MLHITLDETGKVKMIWLRFKDFFTSKKENEKLFYTKEEIEKLNSYDKKIKDYTVIGEDE
jgi:hypothetical protein